MSERKLDITLQVAQKLIDHLAEPMNSKLKDLLDRVAQGKATTVDIIKLLSGYDNIRLWMEEQTSMESGAKGGELRGFGPIPGDPNSVPASLKWVCPKNIRDHWMLVIQEGEDPPTCKVHQIEMIRKSKKKG